MVSKVMQKRQELLAAVLEWVQEKVDQIAKSGIVVKDKYPKAYGNFSGYLRTLLPHQFGNWCLFLGCMVAPISYTEGNNHIVIIDNGLISRHLKRIPVLKYDNESRLVTLHLFGLNRRVNPIGNIHIHVVGYHELVDVNQARSNSITFDLKKIIDKKHEHMEDKAYTLVRLGGNGDLVPVTNQELFAKIYA